MPKRSAHEAVMQAVTRADSSGLPRHKSRSGRVVKPKVWDDGTVAAPVLVLKGEEPAEVGVEKEGDPDYSDDPVEEHLSDDVGAADYELDTDDDANFSDGPTGSYGSHGSRGRYGASRDESGKFTHGRTRGGRGKGGHRSSGASAGSGGGIFKMAAVEVLRQEKRLLSTGEIARLALKRGLIKCSGKTPEATMASALYTDIKRREGQSIFIRPHEGLFGLREWIEQGVPFQDDYAEEMAKRARANFGYMGMMPPGSLMPPVVDKEGKPIAPLPPYYPPYGGPVGITGLDVIPPLMPPMGLPPIPGYSSGGGKSKGRGGKGGAAATAATAQDDDDEGLMQLLNAAEELHRSASKGEGEWEEDEERAERAQRDDMAVDKPTSASEDEGGASQGTKAGSDDEAGGAARRGATAAPCSSGEAGGSQAASQGASGGPEGDAHGAPGLEEALALAAMACRAASMAPSSGVPSEGGSKGEGSLGMGDVEAEAEDFHAAAAAMAGAARTRRAAGSGASKQRAGGEEEEEDDEESNPESELLAEPARHKGALAALASLMQAPAIGQGGVGTAGAGAAGFPFPPYYPPLPLFNRCAGPGAESADSQEPSEDDEEMGKELQDREGAGGALSLVVIGSAKPLQRAQQGRQHHLGGQEQVNILNLPLPDFGSGAAGGKAEGAAQPEITAEQLRQQEALVMRLETDMGTSHPEVGKALLSLAKLYMAEGSARSRQLATAAISRAQDIMTVCQMVLSRQPTCSSAFAYLMGKSKATPSGPRAVDITVAAGDAALLGLSSPPSN